MCCISMDSYQQTLQTNDELFENFFELITIFQNNSGVGFMHARRGGICAEQHAL